MTINGDGLPQTATPSNTQQTPTQTTAPLNTQQATAQLHANNDRPLPPDVPRQRMMKDGCKNFLRLSAMLRLVISTEVDEASIVRAAKLFVDYNLEFKQVRGRFFASLAVYHC